jgi:hypothetical protein
VLSGKHHEPVELGPAEGDHVVVHVDGHIRDAAAAVSICEPLGDRT